MATSFWSGDKAEFLLNKLSLKSGTQIVSTDEDPRITSIDANKGSIAEFNGKWYRKQNDGNTTAWSPFVGFSDDSIYEVFNAEYGDLTDFTNTTINTTTPISGLADYEVTSFPAETPVVTLDPARVNSSDGSVTFRYTLASGTVKAVIYDQDSNEVISSELEANTAKRARLEWTPENTQTSYQLIFEDVSSGTGLFYDSVVYSDSPKETKEFVYLTEWKSYTPVIDSFGSISSNDSFYRRVGDTLEVIIEFSSGTHTASEARFYLPSGLAIDSLKVPTQTVVGNLSSSYESPLVTNILASGGNNYLTLGRDDNSDSGLSNQNGNVIGNSVDVSLFAKIPIQGWKATKEGTVYASDVDTGGTQEEILSSDVTADTSDVFTFPVTIGQKYLVTGQVRSRATGSYLEFLDGIRQLGRSGSNSTPTSDYHAVSFLYTAESSTLTVDAFATGSGIGGNSTRGETYVQITPWFGSVENFIVDVGTKHVSGGEEYPTGDTLNGKPIYARTWIVGTDITATNSSYITGLPTNITPYNKLQYANGFFQLMEARNSSSDRAYIYYGKSAGIVGVQIDGSSFDTIYSGMTITLPYTYDD